MSYAGVVQNGVIVLENGAPLAEGTRVRVEVEPTEDQANQERPALPKAASPLGEMLLKFAGTAHGLPEDMAENHDHYLYGVPKKKK